MKLLDKAKQIGRTTRLPRDYNPEEIELAVAWAKDEVRYQQVSKVLRVSARTSASVYCFLAMALREACRRGKLS